MFNRFLAILIVGLMLSSAHAQVSTSNISNLPDGQNIGGSINSSIIVRPGKGSGETLSIAGWDVDGNALGAATIVATSGNTPTLGITGAAITGGSISGITDLAVTDGGTGASDASGARTNLGLVIGTNVQAYDADLTTYAGITPSANIQTFLGAADYSAMRTQLGLVIGTNVQAYDADLTTYAGITPSANVQSLLGAADYSAMRTQLTLVPGTDVQSYDADLLSWAGVTRASGFDTFATTPSGANLASLLTSALPASKGGTGLTALSANTVTFLGAADYSAMRTQLGLVIGTNVQAYDADLTTWAGVTPGTGVATALANTANASGGFVTADGSVTLTNKTIGVGQLSGQVALTNGGTGANLSDPNADRILFWDDSAGAVTWLTLGTNLSISDTTLNASGGGGDVDSFAADPSTNGNFNSSNWRSDLGLVIGTDVQAFDADLSDLADGSLTGTKVGFADTDNLWTATNVQAALEELNDSINTGNPNGTGAKVHWSQLLGVPAGFSDGTDDGAGGGDVDAFAADPTSNGNFDLDVWRTTLALYIYSPLDSGATPNNDTDDDANDIQAAVDAAAAAGGGVVLLPPGILHITTGIVLPDDATVSVIGADNTTVLKAKAGSTWDTYEPMLLVDGPTSGVGNRDGVVAGIQFDGNSLCPVGIHAYAVVQWQFDNLSFKLFTRVAKRLDGIQNCNFYAQRAERCGSGNVKGSIDNTPDVTDGSVDPPFSDCYILIDHGSANNNFFNEQVSDSVTSSDDGSVHHVIFAQSSQSVLNGGATNHSNIFHGGQFERGVDDTQSLIYQSAGTLNKFQNALFAQYFDHPVFEVTRQTETGDGGTDPVSSLLYVINPSISGRVESTGPTVLYDNCVIRANTDNSPAAIFENPFLENIETWMECADTTYVAISGTRGGAAPNTYSVGINSWDNGDSSPGNLTMAMVSQPLNKFPGTPSTLPYGTDWSSMSWNTTFQHFQLMDAGVVRTIQSSTQYATEVTNVTDTHTPNASSGVFQYINRTDTNAFTIAAPTNPMSSRLLSLDVINSSGGVLGTITWDSAYKLASSFVAPAAGQRSTVLFVSNGSVWIEVGRYPTDADLASWAAVTRASGFDTFTTTPSVANLGSLLTNEGTGVITAMGNAVDASGGFLTYGGLGSVTQAYDADLLSWASVARGTGFDTFTTTPSVTNFFGLLTGEGTGYSTAMANNVNASGGLTSTANGANPSATAGETAVNGSATTWMRSDGAPALTVATTSAKGISELAVASEINTGTDTGRTITPAEFSDSIYGQIPVTVTLGTDLVAMTTGEGKAYFVIPPKLNGMNLVSIRGALHTVSSSGAPLFQVRRVRSGTPVDMLSTGITFDASEQFLSTSSVGPNIGYAINTSNDDVQTDDLIYIDCDTAGTGTKAPQFWLFFQIP